MRILNPLTGNLTPIQSVLRALAAQENCDGEPYDQMMLAADYIDLLEKRVLSDAADALMISEQLDELKFRMESLEK